MELQWTAEDFTSCSGSTKLAKEMAAAAPFTSLEHAIETARDIWFNKVNVMGWLEAFAAHPEIGASSKPISQWSKEEQSTVVSTAGSSTMQELFEWNARYKEKFGFVFLICASGRSSPEVLAELKRRIVNKPIVELETAAEEEMKIIELRLGKLFDLKLRASPSQTAYLPSSKHEDCRPSDDKKTVSKVNHISKSTITKTIKVDDEVGEVEAWHRDVMGEGPHYEHLQVQLVDRFSEWLDIIEQNLEHQREYMRRTQIRSEQIYQSRVENDKYVWSQMGWNYQDYHYVPNKLFDVQGYMLDQHGNPIVYPPPRDRQSAPGAAGRVAGASGGQGAGTFGAGGSGSDAGDDIEED